MVDAALASLPIVAVVVLMVMARWPALRAALVGVALALALSVTAFPFDPIGGDTVLGLVGSVAEAAFTTGAILWIILPALAIYNLQTETSAVDTLRTGLATVSTDPRLTALAVAWFFALLLEGAAGFGTSAALAAPFLVALGMTPTAAVVAAMAGHLVGVTFGAVGTPVVPMVAASGLDEVELSAAIAAQAVAVGWILPVVVIVLLARAYPDAPARPRWATIAVGLAAATAFFVPYLAVATFVGPELPTLAGAIVGGGAFVAIVRSRTRRDADGDDPDALALAVGRGDDESELSLAQSLAPYLVLVVVVLITRLVDPVRKALEGVEISWSLDGGTFTGNFAPLYHPGTMLFVALVAGGLIQRARGSQVRAAVADSTATIVPVGAALLAMLTLARLMVHSGMVDAIAEAAADSLGGAWPLVAPAVGALGTFVTGSATASNALFSDLQLITAAEIGDPASTTLGAQGVGAALGNAIAPHNLIAAAAIVGLGGRESEILRRTLPIALPLVAASGVIALLATGL